MLPSVNFDNELCLYTNKIDYVMSQRVLSTKLVAIELSQPQTSPEVLSRLSHRGAELTCMRCGERSDTSQRTLIHFSLPLYSILLPPRRGKAGKGVKCYGVSYRIALISTPILTFPLEGGRNSESHTVRKLITPLV